MTKFSFEVPLAHMEEFDRYQGFYLALSFLCESSKWYKGFFKKKKEEGKMVILDNSFNELGVPDEPSTLIKLFTELKADFVVSPGPDSWGFEELKKAYKEMIKYVPQEKVLPIVRTREEYEWFKSQGVSNYCVPFEYRPALSSNILNLAYHFLGLLNPWEIRRFNPVSCDTGMPIKLALKGKTIWDWVVEGCPHINTKDIKGFFDVKMTPTELDLARRNMEWINANLAHSEVCPKSHGNL